MEELGEVLENNKEIVQHYGVKHQIPVWIEEMAELTKELCKWARIYNKYDGDIPDELSANVREEITDVTICLDQLRYVLAYDGENLMNEYKYKVDRQLKRIEVEDE